MKETKNLNMAAIPNKQKSHFFFVLFSSTKWENRSCPRWWLGETSGRGDLAGTGGKRVNMVQNMYTHLCKCKNDTY
jgi:hypothetical protein